MFANHCLNVSGNDSVFFYNMRPVDERNYVNW